MTSHGTVLFPTTLHSLIIQKIEKTNETFGRIEINVEKLRKLWDFLSLGCKPEPNNTIRMVIINAESSTYIDRSSEKFHCLDIIEERIFSRIGYTGQFLLWTGTGSFNGNKVYFRVFEIR